jgi:hypothetical protein
LILSNQASGKTQLPLPADHRRPEASPSPGRFTRAVRLARFALPGLALLLAGGGGLRAAEAPPALARVAGAPGMTGAVYGFFDNQTGARTGRLRIGQVVMEYQRKGFLRVAWRPRVVLDQVEFDLGADLAWPTQGTQIVRALQSLGGHDELVLRDVRLHLAGSPGTEIAAPSARLRKGGVLELVQATVSGGPPGAPGQGNFLLWLTGPRAGQLAPANPSPEHRPPAAGATLVRLDQTAP